MRLILLVLVVSASLFADVRVDNVLVKMVPPGTQSLIGAHMEDVKASQLYQKMMAAQKLPELDRFASESGFDPRTDVREILFASTAKGGVLLARGRFRVKLDKAQLEQAKAKLIRHGDYNIYAAGDSGFCILDSTLAAAGSVPVLVAALDEWKFGQHAAARPFLAQLKSLDPKAQFWGFSAGFAGFIADHMPRVANGGVDFSKIFKGVDDTWFQIDMSKGVKAEIHGSAANEQDAQSLRDAAKGLVGFGRLSVPENQPDMLRIWDGIAVEQAARTITIKADLTQDLVERLVQMMSAMQPGGQARPRRTPK